MLTHNRLEIYNYKSFVIRLYQEQHTGWWFYQFYYSCFPCPTELGWLGYLDSEEQTREIAEFCIDEILASC